VDLHLSGKRAFVTGGSAGIGLAVARHLRAEGAIVAICGRDQDRLDAAVTTLDGNGNAFGIRADVTDPQALRRRSRVLQSA
jgi:3-oxoacyl-[acyl-carrier protein] reductase